MAPNGNAGNHKKENGQALVEFALVLLFIILPITFVFVDGAITLFIYVELTNGAREAARAAAIYQCSAPTCTIDPSNTFAQQTAIVDAGRLGYVNNYFTSEDTRWLNALIGYSQCAPPQLTYNPDPPIEASQAYNVFREMDTMTVTLACPHQLLFGLLSTGQITLTGSATMQIEPGGSKP